MPEYHIFSCRNMERTPSQGCALEFEDVLVRCLDGVLLAPAWADPVRKRGLAAEIPPRKTGDEQVLILVLGWPSQLPAALESLGDRRGRFDRVYAYIVDSLIYRQEIEKPAWRRRFSRWHKQFASLDHLFVPMAGNLQLWRDIYGIPVSLVPMACDVARFGCNRTEGRFIHVMGYGRQHPVHSREFSRVYNEPGSDRIYYSTDHIAIRGINDFYAHRRFFWKLVGSSRIGLAYDGMAVNEGGRFTFSFVAQRYFELITAGCLVVGRRPTCPEADELLDWEDATVELPDDDAAVIPFVEDLLADTARLDAAHRRNHAQALRRHDWRHRVADMIDRLDLPRPEALQRELEGLDERYRRLGPA